MEARLERESAGGQEGAERAVILPGMRSRVYVYYSLLPLEVKVSRQHRWKGQASDDE
jgi:hypothetical protein